MAWCRFLAPPAVPSRKGKGKAEWVGSKGQRRDILDELGLGEGELEAEERGKGGKRQSAGGWMEHEVVVEATSPERSDRALNAPTNAGMLIAHIRWASLAILSQGGRVAPKPM